MSALFPGLPLTEETRELVSNILTGRYIYQNGRQSLATRVGNMQVRKNAGNELGNLNHHLWVSALGGELYTAPMKNPRRALDAGTGDGLWAIDLANRYPDCQVTAVDLQVHALQAEGDTNTPPNYKFLVNDLESPSDYSERFDLIHFREVFTSLHCWDEVIRQCYFNIAPGGYIEIQELDTVLRNGSLDKPRPISSNCPIKRWWDLTISTVPRKGHTFPEPSSMSTLLRAAGFQNTTLTSKMWALAAWHEDKVICEHGELARVLLCQRTIKCSKILLNRCSGLPEDEVDKFCNEAEDELWKTKEQYWMQVWFVHAQKPIASNTNPESK
ncbi:S-adenosyl-L-methionine-dependent methyltransferase [Kalaharituber pfeilii]|nr:S-adenosyl-L-methionine-dependent methyltransferase [Kalaharituber pfeilii]